MGKTLTRADLTEAVFREVGLSRTESADLVESLIKHDDSQFQNNDCKKKLGVNKNKDVLKYKRLKYNQQLIDYNRC